MGSWKGERNSGRKSREGRERERSMGREGNEGKYLIIIFAIRIFGDKSGGRVWFGRLNGMEVVD